MATFSPLRWSLPWLGGGLNVYESFSGHLAPEEGQHADREWVGCRFPVVYCLAR